MKYSWKWQKKKKKKEMIGMKQRISATEKHNGSLEYRNWVLQWTECVSRPTLVQALWIDANLQRFSGTRCGCKASILSYTITPGNIYHRAHGLCHSMSDCDALFTVNRQSYRSLLSAIPWTIPCFLVQKQKKSRILTRVASAMMGCSEIEPPIPHHLTNIG